MFHLNYLRSDDKSLYSFQKHRSQSVRRCRFRQRLVSQWRLRLIAGRVRVKRVDQAEQEGGVRSLVLRMLMQLGCGHSRRFLVVGEVGNGRASRGLLATIADERHPLYVPCLHSSLPGVASSTPRLPASHPDDETTDQAR